MTDERQLDDYFAEIEDKKSPMYISPPKNKFSSKLYLLMNSNSFSAATHFATIFSDNNLGTIIGTPTPAKPTSPSGMSMLKLPNSKKLVSISMGFYIRPDTLKNNEVALFPDITICRSIDDYLVGKDTRLEWVIDKIIEEHR